MDINKEAWETSKSYYPELGRVMPDGKLRIPFAARCEDGMLLDGYETIDQNDPRYPEWLELANQADGNLASRKEEKKRVRAERRKASKK